MKRILRNISFFSIVVFITFAVVASNGVSHRTLSINVHQMEDCWIGRLSNNDKSCLDTSKPLAPDLNLPEDKRFLAVIASKLPEIPQPGSYEYTLLDAYGAVFVNQQPEVKLPQKVFLQEEETKAFQANLRMEKVNGTSNCFLQQSAAVALNQAKLSAKIPLKSGYGASDCTRSFATNLRFWRKYANNQTLEKVRQGKETRILSTVAPPGASQHLWGLAVDLRVSSQTQRQALYQNGWFQTVENDVPHWTYVGLTEDKLPLFGFKNKVIRGISYWLTPL
jgi:hypothetical protein